jgi:hypothetical protein
LLEDKEPSKPYYTSTKNYALTFVDAQEIDNIEKFDNLYPSIEQSIQATKDDLEGAKPEYKINSIIRSEKLSLPISIFFKNLLVDCITNYEYNMN